MRHQHFGEGNYERSERVLQRLLGEAGNDNVGADLVAVMGDGAQAPADWASLESPETYLGYVRSERFGSPGGTAPGLSHHYEAPAQLRLNEWALSGDGTVEDESVVLD